MELLLWTWEGTNILEHKKHISGYEIKESDLPSGGLGWLSDSPFCEEMLIDRSCWGLVKETIAVVSRWLHLPCHIQTKSLYNTHLCALAFTLFLFTFFTISFEPLGSVTEIPSRVQYSITHEFGPWWVSELNAI